MRCWLKSRTLVFEEQYIDTFIPGILYVETDGLAVISPTESGDFLIKGATLSFLKALKERQLFHISNDNWNQLQVRIPNETYRQL